MTRIGRLLCLGMLLATSACIIWNPFQRTTTQPQGMPGGDGRTVPGRSVLGRETGVGRKVIKGKREPVTLIADDKTECIVPESKFRETSIGEKATCEWRSP